MSIEKANQELKTLKEIQNEMGPEEFRPDLYLMAIEIMEEREKRNSLIRQARQTGGR